MCEDMLGRTVLDSKKDILGCTDGLGSEVDVLDERYAGASSSLESLLTSLMFVGKIKFELRTNMPRPGEILHILLFEFLFGQLEHFFCYYSLLRLFVCI